MFGYQGIESIQFVHDNDIIKIIRSAFGIIFLKPGRRSSDQRYISYLFLLNALPIQLHFLTVKIR